MNDNDDTIEMMKTIIKCYVMKNQYIPAIDGLYLLQANAKFIKDFDGDEELLYVV